MFHTHLEVECLDELLDMIVQYQVMILTEKQEIIPIGLLQGIRDQPGKFAFEEMVDENKLKKEGFISAEGKAENQYILLKPITSHECPIGFRNFNIVGSNGEIFTEYSLYGSVRN